MLDTYVAALMGMERVGTGELVTMPMPDSGEPPRWLYREFTRDGQRLRAVWEQWGDADLSIYPYVLSGVEPVPAG